MFIAPNISADMMPLFLRCQATNLPKSIFQEKFIKGIMYSHSKMREYKDIFLNHQEYHLPKLKRFVSVLAFFILSEFDRERCMKE